MSGVEIVKIGGAIAFVMPPVIAFINQEHWSARTKGLVAFVLCVLAALLTVLYEDRNMDWADWRNASLMIFAGAQFFYHTFWRPSTIAPSIEKSTTP